MIAVLVLLVLITVCAVHVVIPDDNLHALRHFDMLHDSYGRTGLDTPLVTTGNVPPRRQ